ncbi:MAG: hypothetical protein HY294_15470 [Candidatus Rokubacteria bacterium]|nr:hypothetical protein [Candidatus Rokubacteria bacterium]
MIRIDGVGDRLGKLTLAHPAASSSTMTIVHDPPRARETPLREGMRFSIP